MSISNSAASTLTNLPSPTEARLPAGMSVLDVIIFAAALASDPRAIDASLNKVRAITASSSAGDLSDQDRRTLDSVYNDLETYLAEKEPLRALTRQSIRQRIYDYTQKRPSQSLRRPLMIIWAAIIVMTALPIILPLPAGTTAARPVIAVVLFLTTINAGAAWLFWSARKNFRDELRQVYVPISLGIVLLGTSLFQVPVMIILGSPTVLLWFRYVTASIPVLIVVTLIYVGICRFVKFSNLTSRLTKLNVLVLSALVLVLLAAFLPHVASTAPLWMHLVSLLILVSGTVIAGFTVVLISRMRSRLSLVYWRPLGWLMSAVVLLGINFVQFIIIQLALPPTSFYASRGFSALPLLITGFLMLKAGAAFKRFDVPITKTRLNG
ncbi:MAG TPA: hypothetical protein VLI05_04555 [Candidatus Saccharimonadia bacterium]|nr:hypothetical protein [Candidatus Saccharimonadia bacterium]